MTVLSSGYRSGSNGSLGTFTILFSVPLVEWDHGEVTVYRHLNFDGSLMDWAHPPCRFDALVLALWFHRHAKRGATIPICPCQRVTEIANGRAFPGPQIPFGYGNLDRLEDRVIAEYGHAVNGLGEVHAYFDRYGFARISPMVPKALPDSPPQCTPQLPE